MIIDETKQKFYVFGALGYDKVKMCLILDVSDQDLEKMLDDGGRHAMEIGKAKYEFEIDKKLMTMARGGDIKALAEIEKRSKLSKINNA